MYQILLCLKKCSNIFTHHHPIEPIQNESMTKVKSIVGAQFQSFKIKLICTLRIVPDVTTDTCHMLSLLRPLLLNPHLNATFLHTIYIAFLTETCSIRKITTKFYQKKVTKFRPNQMLVHLQHFLENTF